MAAEKDYTPLGVFIVVVLAVVLATALLFIQRLRTRVVIGAVTYTNENVNGLDISSPVRFRGVPIGRVTNIRVDPRGFIVEIDFEMFVDRLTAIGQSEQIIKSMKRLEEIKAAAPHLRSQVVANPVNGEAYLLLDIPMNPPPPIQLGFTPNTGYYVPSVPSSLSTVQDQLPALLDQAQGTLKTLREIVARVPASLDRSDRFFMSIERLVRDSDLPALSSDSRRFFTTTKDQMQRITSELDGVVGRNGTLTKFIEDTEAAIKDADLPATSRATREAAERSRLAADDLRRSLPAMKQSFEELRELARHLQEEPESVVYGQRPPQVKHQ